MISVEIVALHLHEGVSFPARFLCETKDQSGLFLPAQVGVHHVTSLRTIFRGSEADDSTIKSWS